MVPDTQTEKPLPALRRDSGSGLYSQATFKYLKQFVLYLEIHPDSVDSIRGWLLLGTAPVSQRAEQIQRAALGLAYRRGLFLVKQRSLR